MLDKPLTIVEHLDELRRRIIYIMISVCVTSAVAYIYRNEILEFIIKAGKIEKLVFINPVEAFYISVKLSILVGIVAAMPFILYQIWKYVAVALKKQERGYLLIFGPCSYILFICGATLAFRVVLPTAMNFLIKKTYSPEIVVPIITLNNYITFLNSMIIAFGLVFQLPLVILLLSLLGIVTPEILKKTRKYAIFAIFIFAAVLTPSTDAVSMMMLAVPILILYEISVLLCIIVTKRREREINVEEPVAEET